MTKKVLDYTDRDISTMDALDHMRYRSQMYLGDVHSAPGHVQMLKEALDNSADEAGIMDEPTVIRIIIIQGAGTYQAITIDKGRGIPLKSLEIALTEPRTSGKSSAAYQATAGVFGLGIKATCAMSKIFCGTSSRPDGVGVVMTKDLKKSRIEFDHGALLDDSGTIIFYEPSQEYTRGYDEFVPDGVKELANIVEFTSAFLPQTSIEICLSSKRVTQKMLMETPPADLHEMLANWPIDKIWLKTDPDETPIQMLKRRYKLPQEELWSLKLSRPYADKLGYEINLFLPAHDEFTRKLCLMGSINRKPIHDHQMHHMAGIISAIKERLEKYIEDKHVRAYFIDKYVLPLSGIVEVSYADAVFGGQTKTEFKDRDFLGMYKDALKKEIRYSGSDTWDSLFDLLVEHIETSFHQYHNKSVLTGKFQDISANLNSFKSFKPCRESDPQNRELFIAEGQSAGGRINQVRDVDTQAVFYMRGKTLNCIKASTEALRKNTEVNDLVNVIGVPIGSSNLDTLNFKRIVILTDADADGKHITTQLVALAHKMCPELLTNGHIHIGSPPLYALKSGRKSVFLRDDVALRDFMIERVYTKLVKIELNPRKNKFVELVNDKYRDFCFCIMRIGNIYDTISNRLVIEPLHLEMLTRCIKYLDPLDTKGLQTMLGCDKLTYEPVSNCLVLSVGDIDVTIPMNGLVENIRKYILPELENICASDYDIYLTTLKTDAMKRSQMTVYQTYSVFNSLDKTFSVDRYKGLGEMDAKSLAVSAVNPETRSTVEIRDIGDIDKIFAIMGKDTEARKRMLMS